MTRILLADDHVLFREALVQFVRALKPDWRIDEASSFEEASDILQEDTDYDLLLLDLRMPGMNGLEGLQKALNDFPKTKTCLLSGVAEEHHIKKAVRMGACGYLPKTMSGKKLVKAIELILDGKKFIAMDQNGSVPMPSYHDDFATITPAKEQTKNPKHPFGNLTGREKEVLHHLAHGLSNKDIADILGLKIATVKLHVSSVCKKLNAANRTQAAILAYQNGLIIPK
jgi:DNA-binding NarL/FixJ family response regulator